MRMYTVTMEAKATRESKVIKVRANDLIKAGIVAEATHPGWLAVDVRVGR